MSLPTNDPLNWLALQYVLGELSAADCEAFEERLAHDLAACEAVTNASRLHLTARAALAESADASVNVAAPLPSQASTHRASSPRRAWMAVAGSVVAASLLWGLLSLPRPRSTSPSANSAAELLALWRTGVLNSESEPGDVDTELADGSPVDSRLVAPIPGDDDVDADPDDRSATVASRNDIIPRWMLAAVSIEAEQAFNRPVDEVQEN